MTRVIGRNTNTNDTATVASIIVANATTSVTLAAANAKRLFFCVNVDDGSNAVWVKLQAASVDNDKKGIFVTKAIPFVMLPDNIYTGEISVHADNTNIDVFYTEY